MTTPNSRPALTPEILVPRIGDYLVEKGFVTVDETNRAETYRQALKQKGEYPPPIGQVLVSMGFITREELDQATAEQILLLRESLQRSNVMLEQRVQERTAELEQALVKLSELTQLKANFIANISHELRTPLTHMKGYLELLLGDAFGAIPPEQKDILGIMKQSSDRLGQLIEDLILFSTAERGQINLHLQPINMVDIISKSKTRYLDKAHEKKIDFRVDCPRNLPPVQVDPDKINWVVDQLLDNAIKFTGSGGRVLLECGLEKGHMYVAVSDTGIGIPRERIGELFEPFHQLDGSSTRRYGGTGLGLALVKKIIEAHNSSVHVKSEVGRGSTFEFLLSLS
jgi:two-component system, sensor histidine kinase and response regulator